MNYTKPYTFSLISRNEGKLKSYESCLDVRAWNHDVEVRGSHLRAWIKRDMPSCIIPVSTLVVALRIMGCKSRGRLTPKCRPNCKSSIVLESICTSCETIRECIRIDPKYEKYFEEEDLETSHWPCERCLDALKNIKMLWRILLEKVFRISVPKNEKVPLNVHSNNVLNTTKMWQTDIVYETLFVKNVMPLRARTENVETKRQFESEDSTSLHNESKPHLDPIQEKLLKSESYVLIPKTLQKPRRVSRSISVKIKKVNVGCETIDIDSSKPPSGDSGGNKDYLNNLELNLKELKADVERLKKENISLKIELQNVCNGCHLEPHLCSPAPRTPNPDALAFLPKPFDGEPAATVVDDVDSEMIITMKNCRNPGYKEVSLLQVMHKSNTPFYSTRSTTDASCRREDPLRVLEKLQTTFETMVQREVRLAGNKKSNENPPSDITASYHNVKVTKSRSKPGCEAKLSSVSECDCSKELKK